jgi:DnaJ-class molecular chaperone
VWRLLYSTCGTEKDYRLLQLQAEDNPAQARVQYRERAKRYHPDAGGHHAPFLALQQAYERVVQYQQTFSRMSNL